MNIENNLRLFCISFIFSILFFSLDTYALNAEIIDVIHARLNRHGKLPALSKALSHQGQTPSRALPVAIPYYNKEDIDSVIIQTYDTTLSPPGWAKNAQVQFSYGENVLNAVTMHLDSIPAYKFKLTYTTKKRVSKLTIQYFERNQWVNQLNHFLYYGSKDSLSRLFTYEWDTLTNNWEGTPLLSVRVTYNGINKVDSVMYDYRDNESYHYDYIEVYSYLDDGKIDKESSYYIRSQYGKKDTSLENQTVHLYPDDKTEIVTRSIRDNYNYDSIISTYDSQGYIKSQTVYNLDWEYNDIWKAKYCEYKYNIYDSLHRVRMQRNFNHCKYLNDKPDSTKIFFYYRSSGSSCNRCYNPHNTSEHLRFNDYPKGIMIDGLPDGNQIERISLFDLNGKNVGSITKNMISRNKVEIPISKAFPNQILIYRIVFKSHPDVSGKIVRLKK